MAGIPLQNGTSSSELDITNEAARVYVADSSGNSMGFADAAAFDSSTTKGLVGMGLDHGTVRALQVSRDGRTEIPARRLLLVDLVEGTTLNTQRWTSTATTMTSSQSATTGILLNASAITTINTGIALSSRQTHIVMATAPLHFRARVRSTAVANQEGHVGLAFQGTLSGTAALDFGATWTWGTDGSLKPQIHYAGAAVATGTDIDGSLSDANYYEFHITVEEDCCVFQVFTTATRLLISRQVLALPVSQPRLFSGTHVYTFLRLRNAGSAPASAGQLFINQIETAQLGVHSPSQSQEMFSGAGYSAAISPTAYTQAAQWANSSDPSNATLSNTAAGYTTLGGLYGWAAAASAATDYCLFGFAVPAPYRLLIWGVHIEMWNTGAANAATPATTVAWAWGLNGASANLATGGHIRRGIGATTIAISAAIGAMSQGIEQRYNAPLICEPGTTLAIIAKIVGGAATGSQVIRGLIDVDGTFE